MPVDVRRGRARRLLHNIRASNLALPGDAQHQPAGIIGQRVLIGIAHRCQRAHVGVVVPPLHRRHRRNPIRRLRTRSMRLRPQAQIPATRGRLHRHALESPLPPVDKPHHLDSLWFQRRMWPVILPG